MHDPTSDQKDEIIDEFHDDIQICISEMLSRDFIIIQGDWNSKMDTDACQHWNCTVGKFKIGMTNARGLIHLKFTQSNLLTIVNTLHRHTLSH